MNFLIPFADVIWFACHYKKGAQGGVAEECKGELPAVQSALVEMAKEEEIESALGRAQRWSLREWKLSRCGMIGK